MSNTYDAPVARKIGNFDELTMCLGVGGCRDFLGCGYAVVCFW